MNETDPSFRPCRRRTFFGGARLYFALSASVLALTCTSCLRPNQPKPANQKPTTPVSGIVTIDGEPGFGVQVTLEPVDGIDASNPTISLGEADQEGNFQISTYGGHDGAPPGDYHLTFLWFDRSVVRLGGGDPKDLFKGKYAKPNEHKVSVPPGPDPVDLGTISLSK